MKKNVGPIDRGVRIMIGSALIAAGLVKGMWWAAVIGAIVLATGLLGWCGIYVLLGRNTCPLSGTKEQK